MEPSLEHTKPKILILATLSGGYAGADSVGQIHADYASNTYVLPVLCPSMFPPEFYLRSYEKGIDGIIVMYSGTDSPYKGRYPSFEAGRHLHRLYQTLP
jgi:coenzyme F420-reducing hydrogenase delta subunit